MGYSLKGKTLNHKLKAVLFDMDGTILDTAGDICAAACHSAEMFGIPAFDLEQFHRRIGNGLHSIYEQITPPDFPKETLEAAYQEHRRYYPEHCTERTCFYPGMHDVLRELAARGLKLGIVSNKVETSTVKIAAHYCSDIPFEIILGNNGVRPLKPSVEVGEIACKALHVAPEEVVFLGDGDADMKFARTMGFLAVGATWGYRDRETLIDCGAQVLIDAPIELLQLLDKEAD